MKSKGKKILLSAMCGLLAFSVGGFIRTGLAEENGAQTFYRGDTAAIVATYAGKTAAALTTKTTAPDGTDGTSYIYTNEKGAGATYSFTSSAVLDATSYDGAKFVVYVNDPMTSWDIQFGVFSSSTAKSGSELIGDNIMDVSGIRWEKAPGAVSGLTAGWNELILPLDDTETYDGFARTNYMLDAGARAAMDSFAIRTHSGSTPFEMGVYSAELVKLSDTVKVGVRPYGTKIDPADIAVTVATYDDLAKGSATIEETQYDTFGCTGWGGFAKVLTLDKAYDLQSIASSGRGAMSFYFYIDNADLLSQYAARADADGWNIDVSSGESYSDSHKFSFRINSVFSDCSVGWNKIVIPFATANEKNAMDWSDVRTIRLNCTGFGVNGGNTVAVAGITFGVSDETSMTVTSKPADVVFSVASFDNDLAVSSAEDGGKTFEAYFANGWGGYVSVGTFAQAYNASALIATGKAAFAFRFYFRDEDSLEKYRAVTSWNVDISSGDSYSDAHKYSFNIAEAFSMCRVGWNRVIVPVTLAAEKNDMDWTNVKYVRFNSTGSGLAVATWTGLGELSVVTTKYTALSVEGYIPPEPEDEGNYREACEGDSGLHLEGFEEAFGDGVTETGKGMYQQGTGALRLTGQGTAGTGKKLAHTFDLSGYDAISFDLYVDDAATFLAMADGQLEMTSSGGKNDANEYHWSLKSLSLKDGWNSVTLYFADAERSGEVDITKIDYINFYFVGLAKILTTVFDDLHAHKTEGVVIESFDSGFSTQVEAVGGKVGNATNMSGQGWVARVKLGTPVDISDAYTVALWVYCGDETTVNAIADTEIEISSSGRCDANELAFFLPRNLQVGWNYVTFSIADAKKTGGDCDLTAINFLGVVKTGLPYVNVYFDDLRAIENRFVNPETIQPIVKKIILPCDKLATGVFDGLTVDDENAKEGVASLATNGANANEVLTAIFAPVATGLSLAGERELGYTFWLYVDQASKLNTVQIELSSSEDFDRFELEWTVPTDGLTDGWNWITLRASEATRSGGVIDVDAIVRTRLILFGNEPMTIRLDCFQIVDSTVEGAFDKVETKVVLDPIAATEENVCDEAWENSVTDETVKKEGYSSVAVTNKEGQETVVAKRTVDYGKTDLLIVNYKNSNRFGVSFWLFVRDISAVSEVKFAVRAGDALLSWTLDGLADGWNWIVLDVAGATVDGTPDADSVSELILTVTAASAEGGYKAFAVNVDRVKIINAALEENHAEPADESIERDYVTEKVIIDCNEVGGTTFIGNVVDKGDFRYGNGSVCTSGNGYALNATDLEIEKTDLTKETFVLAFWVWIENPEYYNAEGVNSQVEISSDNSYDVNEINWDFNPIARNLSQGWNWVVLKGSDASVTGGMPDFDRLCRFRIYVNNISESTLKIDRVTIGYVGNEALFTAPEWEKEIDGVGEFKGPNSKQPSNGLYLDFDIDGEAKGFVATEKEPSTSDGCSGSAEAAGTFFLCAIAAAAVMLRRKFAE